jgi:hypothetical protein
MAKTDVQGALADDQGVRALIGQIGADARAFALAEADYIRAELGARASLVVPALVMIAVAAVLGFGLLVTALIGAMMALTPLLTLGGAIAVVTLSAALIALILVRLAMVRLRKAFQPGESV